MIRQIAVASVLVVGASTAMADDSSPTTGTQNVYAAIETYGQRLVVESQGKFPDPQLAAVFDGRAWALSTRWDDSNPNALNVRRKMLENGIRGTFYLNSRTRETQHESLAWKLTGKGECSVGGHSVSHPHLPKLAANEVFYELMANRITLECLTDRPVNSLAFPFGGHRDKDRPEVLHGVTESFLRAGYHHCVYSSFVTQNEFLPAKLVSTGLQVVPGDRKVDASRFWAQVEKVRKFESSSRTTSDCIFLGVHPWQKGKELDRLGEVMGELRNWDDFWHCTQTEYAAFVKQRRNTTVRRSAANTFEIQRPCAFELGSDIPLTLVFDSDTVVSAKADGADCTVRQAGGKSYVNIPHSGRFGVPTRIDSTSQGTSEKFAGLKASLSFEPSSGELVFVLENAADSTLTDLRLTVSVPPAFEPGVSRWNLAQLKPSDDWSLRKAVAEKRTDDYWRNGKPYAAAQLDFVLNGERGRLFTTNRDNAKPASE